MYVYIVYVRPSVDGHYITFSILDITVMCITLHLTFWKLKIVIKLDITLMDITYRVVINERYKVWLYCDFILSFCDFLSLLGAHQMWSI